MTPPIRSALAALLLTAVALPLAAQTTSPSLFQQKPKGAGAEGSAGASLFPKDDLSAAAGISVGIEAPALEPEPDAGASQTDAVPGQTPEVAEESVTPQTTEAVEAEAQPEAAQTPEAQAAAAALAATQQPQDEAEVIEVVARIRPRLRPEALAATPTPEGADDVEDVAVICTDPASVADRDIARNLKTFAANPNLCISEERVSEHGRTWHMVVITNTAAKRGPVWAILHDNEDSAFDAGLYSVGRYGGKMVALETGEQRSFKGQDPNRNFGTTKAITSPCRAMAKKPAPEFTKALNRHFNRKYPVLTMHSNENGYVGNGGAGHISAARSSATMTGMMSTKPRRGLSDEDNALLTAGTQPFSMNRSAQQLQAYMNELGINMIYEHVKTNTNDCSFSFHVKLNNLGDYYNIEVEHGHVEEQKTILDALMAYIGVRPI